MEIHNSFSWTAFYMELADKLIDYKEKRAELLSLLKEVFDHLHMRYPFTENGEPLDDICPFTVFGCFNKGITNENRMLIMEKLREKLSVQASVPTDFNGIPVLNNMKAWFFAYKKDRKPDDIPNLWEMFETAINYADVQTEQQKTAFIKSFDKVRMQLGIKWNLTMGLYWIRPYFYLNLDERNRKYLGENELYADVFTNVSRLNKLPAAFDYLQIITACKELFKLNTNAHHSFPELSYAAWIAPSSKDANKKKSSANFLKWFVPIINALKELGGSGTPSEVRNQITFDLKLTDEILNETRGKNNVNKFENEIAFARNYLVYEGYIDNSVRGIWTLTEKGKTAPLTDEIASEIFIKWAEKIRTRTEEGSNSLEGERNTNEKKYWIYTPGEGSSKWDEFSSQNIMGLGWDEMGDLKQYSSKEAMKTQMKKLYGEEFTYINWAHATWQFANEIFPGDIVYAKKGLHKIIGRGIVESEYIYDPTRDEFKHIHNVKWKNKGEWEHPGQAVAKILTDISPYTEYIQKLEHLFFEENADNLEQEEIEVHYEPYSDIDFLSEVFINEERYTKLVNLLKAKKNIILQGAPGVGKTFSARRLAYSIMGERDTNRIMMVQFHQSYSYEDFIMGYRPTETGFKLTPGPFYEFCKKAQADDRDYFFIIDEINRGNLSKIFGELLMLIEKDKRGQKLRLLYSNELFSVPKNVHIIGMMNTADRSLAMIDYALRRRFAFFELDPAFDSDGFEAMVDEINNQKYKALIEQIKALNEFISKDESLGKGFRIGHSYLITDEEMSDEWLSSVIEFELLPLLDEYWFDEPSKIEQWSNKLRGVLHD